MTLLKMSLVVLVILEHSSRLVTGFDEGFTVFSSSDGAENFKDNYKVYRDSMRKPRFVDIYTNHPNQREVEKVFFQNHNMENKNQDTYKDTNPPVDRKDTLIIRNMEDMFSSPDKDDLESEHGHIESDNMFYNSESNFENEGPAYFDDKYQYTEDKYNYYNGYNTKYTPFITQALKKPSKNKYKSKLFEDADRNNFIFLQSQMVIPDSENYGSFYSPPDLNSEYDYNSSPRPDFLTNQYNYTSEPQTSVISDENLNITTVGYSYVQKIPLTKRRPSTTPPGISEFDSNKYEEIDISHTDTSKDKNISTSNTKKRINDLLKKYVAKLFIEKYADKKINQRKWNFDFNNGSNEYFEHQNITAHQKIPKIDQESKFLFTDTLWELKNKTIAKIKKLFSIFTVIKFNNTECNATNWAGTWQGLCYTALECTQLNGTALGNCANGYGVCCVFRGTCGDSSSSNCSYFKSPNYPDYYPSDGGVITPTTTTTEIPTTAPTPDPRLHWYYYHRGSGDEALDNLVMGRETSTDNTSCVFSVYKTNSNVKQMKIDFIDLDLASPTNGTCTTERLIISGQNANDQIPVICGYNTGQHVYVDVSQTSGPLKLMVLSTTGARKRFKFRICQYTDSCGTPQSNCLQYYTGANGVIQSFNYDQAAMFNRSSPGYFNNLNYAICIRREAGYCSITYSNVKNGQTFPFQLVNRLPNGQLTIPPGQAGVDILNCPDDYVIIDGTRLCGDRFNDGSTIINFSMNSPVMDASAGPIIVHVRTNNMTTGLGFKLYYTQNACTST